MDRALPLLKPGRSFKFSVVSGGKDPDDVLREQGAAALKAQLSQTRTFVEALFQREKKEADFETPEGRTSFKVRLRALAGLIADKELAQEYKSDFLDRWDEIRSERRIKPDASDGGRAMVLKRNDDTRRGRITARVGATPEGRVAALKLRESLSPFSAALIVAIINHPQIIDGQIEKIMNQGLGNDILNKIAGEIASLWIDNQADTDFIRKRLYAIGIDELHISEIERKASHITQFNKVSGEEEMKLMWSSAFEAFMKLLSLERAIEDIKPEIEFGENYKVFTGLKTERDIARKQIETGNWQNTSASIH
jgi:DNA primase